MNFFGIFDLENKLQILDIGAAIINETPIYERLINMDFGYLSAFDGDSCQIEKIIQTYGKDNVSVYNIFLFDGNEHEAFICKPESGMTSLFKPKKEALDFFNGFSNFGEVQSVEKIQTSRLDDLSELISVDFLKMDVQGAELGILKNGENLLNNCLGFQLEVSFFSLYEDQPTFGDIDLYMRSKGYVPHQFIDVKKWSIAPTIFNGNFRTPGNQLLESDIIYIKDPLLIDSISDIQLKKFSLLSHYCFQSPDLNVFLLIEMEKRKLIEVNSHKKYIKNIQSFT